MLYDNVVVTATKPAAQLSRQKSSSAHLERHSNASGLPGQGSTDFATFEKAVEKDPSYLKIRHDSPDFEYASTRDDLVKIWSQHLDYAQDAEVQFGRRGKTRRALKQTTEFLNTFKTYMDAYGGVVELMASAGGGYGQTAYSTMSIFLTIAANKQDRDDKISETLEKLCKLYSRFPTLERIHPSPEMRSCIEEAYRIGIDFARYASLYYLRSSIGRLWDVICNPPEVFEETLREITDTMQDIRDEAAFRDSERLHRVEATMKQNQARLEASQKQVQDAQRDAQLEYLREKILPNYPYVTQEMSEYQKRLDAMFDGQRRDIKGRLPQLRQTKEFQRWQTRKKSSILILRGEARQETHFSWFSPLTMALCRDYQRERTAVAFHCCQPLDNSAKGHRLVEVLSHLSFQLLHTSTRPLGLEAYQSIRDTFNKPGWGKDLNLAMSVLTEIIRNLDTVTLIVDRADLIRGDWEENLILLCQLTSRSIAQGCNVKLIVIGSRVRADWRDVEARMRDFAGAEGVFKITSAEGDWDP